jgi:hypothetical protein
MSVAPKRSLKKSSTLSLSRRDLRASPIAATKLAVFGLGHVSVRDRYHLFEIALRRCGVMVDTDFLVAGLAPHNFIATDKIENRNQQFLPTSLQSLHLLKAYVLRSLRSLRGVTGFSLET